MLIDFYFLVAHSSCLKVMTDCSISVDHPDSIIARAVTLSLRNVLCCDGVTGGEMLCLPYDLTILTRFRVFFSLKTFTHAAVPLLSTRSALQPVPLPGRLRGVERPGSGQIGFNNQTKLVFIRTL